MMVIKINGTVIQPAPVSSSIVETLSTAALILVCGRQSTEGLTDKDGVPLVAARR